MANYFRALFVSSGWPRQGLGTRESNIGNEWLIIFARFLFRVVGRARAWARESPI